MGGRNLFSYVYRHKKSQPQDQDCNKNCIISKKIPYLSQTKKIKIRQVEEKDRLHKAPAI